MVNNFTYTQKILPILNKEKLSLKKIVIEKKLKNVVFSQIQNLELEK